MAFINSIDINQFRGIRQLNITNLSGINLLVGDNNSGKTSFLEAVQLLFSKPQLGEVKKIINQRTVLNPDNNSFYTSFIKMFNVEQDKENMIIGISAHSNKGLMEFQFIGSEKTIVGEDALEMSTLSARQKNIYKMSSVIPETAKVFTGKIIKHTGKESHENNIRCTSLDTGGIGGVAKKEVHYVSPFGHLRYDLLQNIVENQEYKKLVIDILRKFDSAIADICYIKTDDGAYIETIITNKGVNMPFSVYGDGMKRMLYIVNKLFAASDSILMIDEIENGLHKKYYDVLFPVVFELAKKLNVQLFIATHNIEVIQAILEYGKYEENNKCDPIRVITLKRIQLDNDSNIVARNVTGKYVYENRKVFEFEVRL